MPASLAVGLLGASASVAITIGGCDEVPPDPIDAGEINKLFDAGVDGSDGGSGSDGAVMLNADGGVDSMPDAYVPPPPDAYVPPPPDAYVPPPDAPPDAPDGPDH
jgi:hypothetical protein